MLKVYPADLKAFGKFVFFGFQVTHSFLNLLNRHRHTVVYGLSLALLLFGLRWLELHLIIMRHANEVYVGVIALLFTGLGIWLAGSVRKPKIQNVVEERIVPAASVFVRDEMEISRLNLSKRELEVLECMAEGLTNHDIAERLFVSVNTIKTHSSRMFEKLEVKSRTQAIEKSRRLSLIP